LGSTFQLSKGYTASSPTNCTSQLDKQLDSDYLHNYGLRDNWRIKPNLPLSMFHRDIVQDRPPDSRNRSLLGNHRMQFFFRKEQFIPACKL
jgi:hypothetical protein